MIEKILLNLILGYLDYRAKNEGLRQEGKAEVYENAATNVRKALGWKADKSHDPGALDLSVRRDDPGSIELPPNDPPVKQ